MKLKTLLAVAVAGAFALPLAAQASADGDRIILAQAAGSSAMGTGPTGGVPSTQSAGEPKASTGERTDTTAGAARSDRCLGMTGVERDNCMRDDRASSRSPADTGAVTSSGGATVGTTGSSATGSSTTGTTAGPDSASNRTAPSSDTATSPSTSGQGKPR
jgi:hypothetical protein